MVEQASRYTLSNRYLFRGSLVMQTALHIGGGRVTLSGSNSPVVLTPEELPFIPGSSFKGSLRSTVEKFVPSLPHPLFTCALIELDKQEILDETQRGRPICSTTRQKEITKKRRDNPGREESILKEARDNLCHTCQLFGSPFAAARVFVNDLYMPETAWSDVLQIRDGVAIDRDSEKAKDRYKYNFEVVPASAIFDFEMVVENATSQDLQLLSVGLSEFVYGFATIGGKRSRGLGVCRLENLQVSALKLIDSQEKIDDALRTHRLRNYLLRREFSSQEGGRVFLDRHIADLLSNTSL